MKITYTPAEKSNYPLYVVDMVGGLYIHVAEKQIIVNLSDGHVFEVSDATETGVWVVTRDEEDYTIRGFLSRAPINSKINIVV